MTTIASLRALAVLRPQTLNIVAAEPTITLMNSRRVICAMPNIRRELLSSAASGLSSDDDEWL